MGRHFVEMMSSEGNYPIKMSLISGVVFTPFWFEYLFHNDNFQSCWCLHGYGLETIPERGRTHGSKQQTLRSKSRSFERHCFRKTPSVRGFERHKLMPVSSTSLLHRTPFFPLVFALPGRGTSKDGQTEGANDVTRQGQFSRGGWSHFLMWFLCIKSQVLLFNLHFCLVGANICNYLSIYHLSIFSSRQNDCNTNLVLLRLGLLRLPYIYSYRCSIS